MVVSIHGPGLEREPAILNNLIQECDGTDD
jgi:hypothetical protein